MIKPEDLEPEIWQFEFYLDAFAELASCRVNGMGLGAIPFTAIVEYSKIYSVGDLQEFIYIIRRMDNELLRLDAAKSNKTSNKAGKKK